MRNCGPFMGVMSAWYDNSIFRCVSVVVEQQIAAINITPVFYTLHNWERRLSWSKTCSLFITRLNHENVSDAFSGNREAQFCCMLCVDSRKVPALWHPISFSCEVDDWRTYGGVVDCVIGAVHTVLAMTMLTKLLTLLSLSGLLISWPPSSASKFSTIQLTRMESVEELAVFWPGISQFTYPVGFSFYLRCSLLYVSLCFEERFGLHTCDVCTENTDFCQQKTLSSLLMWSPNERLPMLALWELVAFIFSLSHFIYRY